VTLQNVDYFKTHYANYLLMSDFWSGCHISV